MYDKGFIWNPSNCECECDKSCDIGKYLDYEECSENIDANEMLYNEILEVIPLNVCKKVCSSCMVYIVLFVYVFNNKHMHFLCFYSFLLVFKKRSYKH